MHKETTPIAYVILHLHHPLRFFRVLTNARILHLHHLRLHRVRSHKLFLSLVWPPASPRGQDGWCSVCWAPCTH